ncbi:MAG TPA: toxic anion resistance protein, partial [Chloroflexota bacterium]
MSVTLETPSQEQADELTLDPPHPVPPVSPDQAANSLKIDEGTAKQIDAGVGSFVDSLIALDAKSPDFEHKVQSISRMGNEEIRRSAAVSQR